MELVRYDLDYFGLKARPAQQFDVPHIISNPFKGEWHLCQYTYFLHHHWCSTSQPPLFGKETELIIFFGMDEDTRSTDNIWLLFASIILLLLSIPNIRLVYQVRFQ